ncbi:MAG: transporter substrate-binding domain-containing protein [Thermodesulfobacteriota bacterium]
MRKNFFWTLTLISLICLLGLTACGDKDPLTASERAWLEKKGVLNIGVFEDYPPFGFVDETKQPVGMSIDYWNLIAQKLKLQVTFHPSVFDKQLKGLEGGQFDSLAGIFPLPERQKDFDFTKSFYAINTNLFISPGLGNITLLQDLPPVPVGVVEGDSSQEVAKKAKLKMQVFSSYSETVMSLAHGQVKAIILDEPVVAYYIKVKGLEAKIRKVPEPVAQGWMTLPVKAGNMQLLNILNKGMVLVSPQEWQAIEQKWVGPSK